MKNIKAYKNEKGFTLVELIVVIVILAILAAILVPGLLKWIDKAKEEQYVLEARNIYMAAEAELAAAYSTGTKPAFADADVLSRIYDLAGVKSLNYVTVTYNTTDTGEGWEIIKLETGFTSSDNKYIIATLENGTWNITVTTL